MNNDALKENFLHIRSLARAIEEKFQGTSSSDQRLQNEIAGMFAVTIAASYEDVVRETLVNYAAKFHPKYRNFVSNEFSQMNARISIDKLEGYSLRFGLSEWKDHGSKKTRTTFHKILNEKKKLVERLFRTNLSENYKNILIWRNAYAHERSTSATFCEVYKAHRVGQFVVRSFVQSFELG